MTLGVLTTLGTCLLGFGALMLTCVLPVRATDEGPFGMFVADAVAIRLRRQQA